MRTRCLAPGSGGCWLAHLRLLGAGRGAKVKKHASGTREATITGKAVCTGNRLLLWTAVTQSYESVVCSSLLCLGASPWVGLWAGSTVLYGLLLTGIVEQGILIGCISHSVSRSS